MSGSSALVGTQPWLLSLPPQLLRAVIADMANEAWNELDDTVPDEFLWTKWDSNVINISHVMNQERHALCLVCHKLNGLVDHDAGTGPPFCSAACNAVLCSRLSNLLAKCPPPPVAASSSSGVGSSLALTDDFDEGDERAIAGRPDKRPKLSSAALLARLLRPGETFSLIGNHPNAGGDDFASSQSIRKQLPPILKDAFDFDQAAFDLLIQNTNSYDVNASGDNTVEHVRYDAARFLLDLYEADGLTRALGMGGCIDHLEQLRCRYDLANQSNAGNIPDAAIPYFGKNITQTTAVKHDQRPGRSDRVVTYTGAHMRPETYAGTNLCVFEFIQGGLFDAAKCLKRVPVAIAGHANGVEGGLAVFLRDNLVKLLRSLASDEAIAAIPKEKVVQIDVTALKRYVARNKPAKDAVPLKEKKKHEPARKAK